MSDEQDHRLILICEGGAHSVEYFHRNEVYPGAVVLTSTRFREMMPYLSKSDEVLLVINGLTDFTLSEIYALLNDLEEVQEKLDRITVVSNVMLGSISADYYLYSGDLFYGEMKEVVDGKVGPLQFVESKSTSKSKKSKKDKSGGTEKTSENTDGKFSTNAVMEAYKKYSHSDVRFTVYGSEKKDVPSTSNDTELWSRLINIDLF